MANEDVPPMAMNASTIPVLEYFPFLENVWAISYHTRA